MRYVRPRLLLYIEPESPGTKKPLVDALTRKMAAAYRMSKPDDFFWCGVHQCICGAFSDCRDHILPSGLQTNSLCVHYLAHHRDEVPAGELEKVARLDCGEVRPRRRELRGDRVRGWGRGDADAREPRRWWWPFRRRGSDPDA